MIRHAALRALVLAAFVVTATAGCGTSGSNPVLFSEVVFHVTPLNGGTVTFSVDSLEAGGVRLGFSTGTTFTTSSTFDFYVEGAGPPYSGTFMRAAGSGDIEVTLTVKSTLSVFPTTTRDSTTETKPTAIVMAALPGAPPLTPVVPSQLVRFDVCAPLEGSNSCATNSMLGDPGRSVPYSGTLGDPFTTHLLGIPPSPPHFTPSIYFLPGARDSASAVFRSNSGQLLHAELLVNGEVRQAASETGDLVLQEDL